MPSAFRQLLGGMGLHYDDAVAAIPVPAQALTRRRLNRVCHPAVWDDPEWTRYGPLLAQPGWPNGVDRLHRKQFEWIQCLYGLEALGALGPTVRILGVGAGHEPVLYYLANRSRLTVASDLYGGEFVEGHAGEADPAFLRDPGRFAPIPYRRDALIALPADGCALPFADSSFDVVFSLSSIEHFGGHDRATVAMREMARVLRPGGICCIATELVLEGGDHPEFFTRTALEQYVIRGSRMVMVERLDETPMPRRYLDDPIWLDGDVLRTPHLVLGRGALRWTSVILFLRKPTAVELAIGAMRAAVVTLVKRWRRRR